MFIGEYSHTIDAKGRLIVPSKFREQLGDEFVVTKGLDGCLFVYENSEWRSFEEKLHALPLTNAQWRISASSSMMSGPFKQAVGATFALLATQISSPRFSNFSGSNVGPNFLINSLIPFNASHG